MKLLHKDIEYEVLVDEPIDSNLNEDLDSATILLENSTVRINFNILDEVKLGDYYFCISDYEERMVNPNEPHYDYTISLVSQIKETEGIVLPNLRITKTDKNLSVYDYIDRYMSLYSKKVRDNNHILQFAWDWSGLSTKFNMLCPEMQWNRPTLREVLTDLMMVADCIPILNNGVIGYIDLSQRKSDVISGINYIHRSKSLEDYATEIEMELQNVIQDKNDRVYNLTNMVEYTGFRNENEYALNTENALIYTKKGIYDIKHLWMCLTIHLSYTTGSGAQTQAHHEYRYVEVDLCNVTDDGRTFYNIVKEHKEFITMPIVYSIPNPLSWSEIAKYQNLCLFYNRGNNIVDNIFNVNKRFWYIYESNFELYWNLMFDRFMPQLPSGASNINKSVLGGNLKGVSFRIEYECLANTKFKAGKYLPQENERIIVDNQTNSFVNANRQGLLEYMKANRLGNEMLVINARYDDLNSAGLVEVGNVYDNDYVIFKRQIKINPNYIQTIYYATKHYVLKDYYTGIKSKIRSWKIDDEESIVRNELHKYYYEFSFNQYSYDDTSLPVHGYQMFSPFLTHFNFEVIKNGVIKTQLDDNSYLPKKDNANYEWIIVELNNKVLGNSISFSTQMLDNYSAGLFIDNESQVINGTPYPVEKDARYVNDIGELKEIIFRLADSRKIDYGEGDFWPDTIETIYGNVIDISAENSENLYKKFLQKPLAKEEYILNYDFEDIFNFNKDQREIIALTIQLEYCSDTEDIVFGSQFVKDNNFISTNYREEYDESGSSDKNLYSLTVYNTLPSVGADGLGLYAVKMNGNGDKYYQLQLENSDGILLDTIVRNYDFINIPEFIANLSDKYVAGFKVVTIYNYPVEYDASRYYHLATANRYEMYYELNYYLDASNYNGLYAIGWTYNNVRVLDTDNIDIKYQIIQTGVAIESANVNYRYKIVNHLVNPSYNNGRLYNSTKYSSESALPNISTSYIGYYVACLHPAEDTAYLNISSLTSSSFSYIIGGNTYNETVSTAVIRITYNVSEHWETIASPTMTGYDGSNVYTYYNENYNFSNINDFDVDFVLAQDNQGNTYPGGIDSYNAAGMTSPANHYLQIFFHIDTGGYAGSLTVRLRIKNKIAAQTGLTRDITVRGSKNDGTQTYNLGNYEVRTGIYEVSKSVESTPSVYYLYEYVSSNNWEKRVTMSSIQGNSNTFRENTNNKYWNGSDWDINNVFEYQLWYSQNNYWYLNQNNYTVDNTYNYRLDATYYKWTGNALDPNQHNGNRIYYWNISNGTDWVNTNTGPEIGITPIIGGWVGTTINDVSTSWWVWDVNVGHYFSYKGNTTTYERYDYYFYTSDGLNLIELAVNTNNKYRLDNLNYSWDNGSAKSWYLNSNYNWILIGNAANELFIYNNVLYQYNESYKSFEYYNNLIPHIGYNRTDLKMFHSPEKVKIYDMNHLPDERYECVNWSFNIDNITNSIDINLGNVTNAVAYYITDNNNNVLLAFNRHTNSNIETIYLNGLISRIK